MFGSSAVTLSPIVFSGGFPEFALAAMGEPLRSEIIGHYENSKDTC